MILIALLLGSLGLADLARVSGASRAADGARPSRRAAVGGAALGIAAFLLASLGSGLAWWWSPIAAVAIIGWLAATREGSTARRSGYWALGSLAALIVAAFVWGPRLPPLAGPLVDWYDTLPYRSLAGIDLTTFALALGGALFLIETSNVIVRVALRVERAPVETGPAHPPAAQSQRRRWWRSPRPEPRPEPTRFVELKGGRFIGPLERLFLLALVLAGQFTAIAALVAAKGIVRFPEISQDSSGGSKAEYFLVGSFASWALVLIVALLVGLGLPQA